MPCALFRESIPPPFQTNRGKLLLGNFRYQFNFDAGAERDLGHPKSAARVSAVRSENFFQELGGAVGYQVLFRERGYAVNQHHHLYDPFNFIKVTHGSVQSAEKVNGNSSCSPLPILGRGVAAELTGPRNPVPLGDVAGDINRVARSDERNKGRNRYSDFWKVNV